MVATPSQTFSYSWKIAASSDSSSISFRGILYLSNWQRELKSTGILGTCFVSSDDFSLIKGTLRTSKRLKIAEISSYYIFNITALTAYLAVLNSVETMINYSCHLWEIAVRETALGSRFKISSRLLS